MKRLLLLLVSSCTFHTMGTKSACLEWADALDVYMRGCNVAPNDLAARNQQNVALCGRILHADADVVRNECIPRLEETACGVGDQSCDGLVFWK